MNSEVVIKHIPHGINPYDKKGFERYPADPVENDFVIIKSIVEPYNENNKIFLRWTINNTIQPPLEAKAVRDGDNGAICCQFELGRFMKNDSITYFIEVQEEENIVQTKEYSFKVLTCFQMDKIKEIEFKNNLVELSFFKEGAYYPKIYFIFNNGNLRILTTLNDNIESNQNTCYFEKISENIYIYTDNITGCSVKFFKDPFEFIILDKYNNSIVESCQKPFNFLTLTGYVDGKAKKIKLSFKTYNECYYGFGERFNKVNQCGLNPDNHVFEEFTNQQEKTYMPIPFFFTEKGFGMFIKSSFYSSYGLSLKTKRLLEIESKVDENSPFLDLYIFTGKPIEVIKEYLKTAGYPALPPKWSFGPWMSGNRWNTQEESIKQIEMTKKFDIPATVFVLEAWSDEATFYIFNDAIYNPCQGKDFLEYKNFSFDRSGKWPDPKGLIEYVHGNKLKMVLWQIPVIKNCENVDNDQHASDEEYVIKNKYCAFNVDGTPYRITYNWFCNSLLIDFTNPQAKEWWFNKRKYLLEDLNVDGFKTDGGEFIFEDATCFYNGKTGYEMRNLYPVSYISSYHDFIGNDHITFSRAGFTGAQKYPLYWAGDQKSTFKEFKSVLAAGLSVNISGNPFWGFDIAGFAGKMPTAELYIRSTQMAAFCPVMQYHSEPPEGSENNDRTPWNVALFNNDDQVIDIYRFYANVRMNLLPYIYNEACFIAANGEPFMRPLIIDYADDSNVYNIEDEYLFGRSLLIAPIVENSCRQREIYLPDGEWVDFWDGTKYSGNRYIQYKCDIDRIPVFVKNNSIIPLNLNNGFEIGGTVGNEVDKYINLCFMIVGEIANTYEFIDDLGNRIILEKENGNIKAIISGNIKEVNLLMCGKDSINKISRSIRINNINCRLYTVETGVNK